MGGGALIASFGWFLIALSVTSSATLLVAVAHDERFAASGFFVSTLSMVAIGGLMILAFRNRTVRANRRNSLALIVALWCVLPVFAAAPFGLVLEVPPVTAYLEAVSALTTTGSTTLPSIDALPRAIVFWRAVLEWFGGALTLLVAAAALDATQAAGTGGVHILSSGLVKTARLVGTLRSLLPLYTLLTALCFVALRLAGVPGFDAACLSLSVLATGGAMPVDGDLAGYGAGVASIVMVFMMIGAANLLAIAALRSPAQRARFNFGRVGYGLFLGALIALLVSMIFVGRIEQSGADWDQAVFEGVFTTVSLATTSGYIHDSALAMAVPLPVVVTLVLVGGAHGSTAGGLKIERVGRMIEDASRELDWLIHPSAVSGSGGGRSANIEPRRILWSYLIAYLLAAAVLAMVLAGAGFGFETALFAAVATLSNAGPAIDYIRPLHEGAAPMMASLTEPLRLFLAGGMILGRIEILAILAILTPLFWRR